MLKKSLIWPILLYGLVIIAFGCYGYLQSGSKISLWSGVGLGGFLVVSALIIMAGRTEGVYLALATTLLLTGVFTYRYAATASPLPAVLAVASGGMLLFLFTRTAKWRA